MRACIGEGNGNPLQYFCLENPRDRGAWWAAVYGVAQSRIRLKRLSSSSSSSSSRVYSHIFWHYLMTFQSLQCNKEIKDPKLPQLVVLFAFWVNYQFSSVAQSCPTLCDPMNCSTTGLPVHHQLPEFTQIYIHWVSDALQPSHPLSSPSPPAPNPSQHESLFQRVNSSHEVAKVLEFQL